MTIDPDDLLTPEEVEAELARYRLAHQDDTEPPSDPYPDEEPEPPAAPQDELKPRRKRRAARSKPTTPTPAADPATPGKDGQEVHRGQLRWSLRFADRHRGEFIWTSGRGWLAWSGSHWRPVEDAIPARAALGLLRASFYEMPGLTSSDRDELFEDIRKAESANGVSGILRLAATQEDVFRTDSELDQQPDLFAFQNGVYELLTDRFRPSRPEDLITKVAGCDYDPAARCPVYDAGMVRYHPDPEVRAYVHRIGGSAMQGRVTEQTLSVWHGSGANGKGTTLTDSWLPVFGDYGTTLEISVLMSKSGDSMVMQQKAELAGARLVVTSEPEDGMKFAAGTMKGLTGGNIVTGKQVFRKPFKFKPSWQIVMECNTRPIPPADDDAVWRRLRQVEWSTVIPEAEWDKRLPQKLAAELPGIANRLLEGWRDYRDNGIRVPVAVREATAEWRADVDTVGQFLADECYRGATHSEMSSAVYARWVTWCRNNGEDAGSNKAFTGRLRKKGFELKRSNGSRWIGLMLRPNKDDQ